MTDEEYAEYYANRQRQIREIASSPEKMKEQHGRAQALYQLWRSRHKEVVNEINALGLLSSIYTLHERKVLKIRWRANNANIFVSYWSVFPLMTGSVAGVLMEVPEDQHGAYVVQATEADEPAKDGSDRVFQASYYPLRPAPDNLEVAIYRYEHFYGWCDVLTEEADAARKFGPVPETATDEEKAEAFWGAEMRLKQCIARIDD